MCAVDDIVPNPDQPRNAFSQEALEGLAETIRERGILQPLLVMRRGDRYELIAGERRWRAAKMLGLETVPVIVMEVDEADRLEISLLENIQRENLNPIEEARAFRTLLDRFGFTQETLARKIGKDRSSLSNTLRLLNLPKEIQAEIARGELSAGHGRALLSLSHEEIQTKAKRHIKSKRLSVRDAEAYVKKLQKKAKHDRPGDLDRGDPDIEHLRDELCRLYGTKVTILRRGPAGCVQIHFFSVDDLDRIYQLLTR
ncbi:MAG: ParB/RepB/Spo0J family partition protein [Rubrivivax sp.]|nr:ParB/RepB/Spo0J family partition protein [Rubrivivax sp.]